MSSSGSSSECGAHGNTSAEVRALAESLAEALEPWAQRLRRAAEEAAGERDAQPDAEVPDTCLWCPVCAAVGLLRGERPELAARLAEHGVGLLSALRELLAESGTPASAGTGADRAARRKRDVQRVPLRRAGGARQQPGTGGGAGC